jgi:galactose mutarotase-like enzyme
VPLVNNTSFEDYFLQFNKAENTGRWPLSAEGQIELHTEPFLNNTDVLPLKKSLFYKDALVFKHLQSDAISILSNKTDHGIEVSYKGFPFMGIWNAKDADFVCIEPWCGIADSVNATGNLADKEGINKLQSSAHFSAQWTAKFF